MKAAIKIIRKHYDEHHSLAQQHVFNQTAMPALVEANICLTLANILNELADAQIKKAIEGGNPNSEHE